MSVEFITSEIAGLFAYLFSNRDFYSLIENNHDTEFFDCMKKLQQEIVKGSINNVHKMNKFIQNALPDRPDKTAEFSKKSIQAMSEYSSFYKQNQETIEKYHKTVNDVQYDDKKGYVNELNTLYNMFDVSNDVKCYGVLAPVPQKIIDGQAFDNTFLIYYDTTKNEKDKYIGDSLLLERKVSTPLHESTHILFGHSRIKQTLIEEKGTGAKHLLSVLNKYFQKHPEAMISNTHTVKTNSIRAIDEAFAASSGTVLGKKYGITSEKFYYGFEGANAVAKSLFPVFVEYMNNNQKIDDNFYKIVADKFAKQEQLNSYKTFDEIISSVSDNEMMAHYQPRRREELNEDNLQLISPEKQRFYLAFYARAAHEHVGFEAFDKENQEQFKMQIEQLYANISQDRPQGEFLHDLVGQTAKYIEDRHFLIKTGNQTFHGGEKAEPRSVGSNFFYNKNKPAGYQSLGQGWDEVFGNTWEIGTMKQGSEYILVVSIPNLNLENDYESWQDFIETFDKVYLPHKEKWDNGRIILDVRGNRGGEDKPIDHVAKRLYGNMLNTYKRCEIKDTALSNYFLHQHGAYKPQNYEKHGLKAEDLIERHHFSGENKTLFDETKIYYPFNEQTGYQGKIDILIDKDVGSSAESAYTSFYHHKNVRYIGENTHGMQQYTQGTFTAPWGGTMRVGVTKLTYWDKEGENIEVKGHKPDINCSGQDAFDVALTLGVDEGRIIGFREKNEKASENQSFAEYNPKSPTDPRKAYYAKYLDPAITEIDMANNVRGVCHDIYHKNIAGLLSEEDKSNLENMFMQTTGVYNQYEPQTISNPTTYGKNVEKIQNVISTLCQGKHPANRQIKQFMLEKGYALEKDGRIELTPAFILQTPDNGSIGGYTKSDKEGNVLIVISQQQAERSDGSLAVVMGHEICHQMINDKLRKNTTSAEVEALCDLVGLVAAKGAGYDIRDKIAEDKKDYSRETQKEALMPHISERSPDDIEEIVDKHMSEKVNALYMPEKLNKIAEFIDAKVPINNDTKQQNAISEKLRIVREKLELRGMSSYPHAPYKSQKITINPNTLHLYQSRKQNN